MKENRFLPPTTALAPVLLQAEPEPVEIDLKRTAVVLVDMQNAFVSRGGMFDLWGFDITGCQRVIEPIKEITSTARTRGIKVIYIAHRYSLDLCETGGPESSHWYKSAKIVDYYERPEWRNNLIIRGTWGAEIVEELKPLEGDTVVEKPRFSAFFGTNLDVILKTYNIRYLVFVGVATNICVEASIRDASYLDYFPILVSDATANEGPQLTQEATIFNVKAVYGWVTTAENFVKAVQK